MKQLNILPNVKTRTQILVSLFDNDFIKNSIRTASLLRKAGFNIEIYYEPQKIHKQLSYADKKGIPLVIIEGQDEIREGRITVKNMAQRTQVTINKDDVVGEI